MADPDTPITYTGKCGLCDRALDKYGRCPAHGYRGVKPGGGPKPPADPGSGLTVNPAAAEGHTGAEPGLVYDDPDAEEKS